MSSDFAEMETAPASPRGAVIDSPVLPALINVEGSGVHGLPCRAQRLLRLRIDSIEPAASTPSVAGSGMGASVQRM